ncbi:647_t:CDS:2 [Rhizophagus irregularis]|nr:647_t:CDS:2 [Rhizophagus irregularis]
MSSHLSVTFDESSLRSNSSSPTLHLLIFRGSLVKWTFFVICMEYRDSVIQKCNSKEILSANEELPNLHIPHQEENQQELRDYFDDELWQDMKFTLNIRSRTCLQFVRRRFEDRMPTTGLPTANNNIEDTHSHNYVDPIIKSFFPKAKIQLQAAGRQDHLLERRNDSILALLDQTPFLPELMYAEIKPPKARADLINQDPITLRKTMRASKDCLLDLIVCGLHVIEFTFPKAQQLGETHGCFSGDGHSAGH